MSSYATDILGCDNEIYEQDSLIQDIVRLLRDDNLILFIGSGLSRTLYGTWFDLIRDLCNACGVPIENTEIGDMKAAEFLPLAQRAKEQDEAAYAECLENRYGSRPVGPNIYPIVAGIKASAYVTLNFDEAFYSQRVIVSNGQCENPIVDGFNSAHLRNQRIFHLHGMISQLREKGIVLTSAEFDLAYEKNGSRLEFVKDIFSKYNVLFLGCDLDEPIFKKIFDIASDMRANRRTENPDSKNHLYMFRPKPVFEKRGDDAKLKPEEIKENDPNSQYTEFGINVWTFDKVNDDFQGLDRVLFYLKKKCLPKNSFAGGLRDASNF